MYSKEDREWALYVLEECGSLRKAEAILDGPRRETIRSWACEEGFDYRPGEKTRVFLPYEEKLAAVTALLGGESGSAVARRFGVSKSAVFNWRRMLLEEGEISLMSEKDIEDACELEPEAAPDDVEELKRRCRELELKNAVLEQTIVILKKDPGVDPADLTNREKTAVVDALRGEFDLRELLGELGLARATYYHNRNALLRPDKHALARRRIREIFEESRLTFGSERIWATLRLGLDGKEPFRISEKVVRRLMREEGLVVIYNKRKRTYSSYRGEISDHPGNKVRRRFAADAPNRLWLTDITQFSLGDARCYLSPVIDCFDGKVVAHRISKMPTAHLVNSMLEDAIATLSDGERPVVHTDCGCHYRWPAYLALCERHGIIRSMSRKACSPDNAACEGFFGRLKNEFFTYRDWSGVSFEEFKRQLSDYIAYYNESRPKRVLGWKSPNEYRRSLGYAA